MEDLQTQFTDAFERFSDELFRHASMRLPDRERARELTQEAFLKAWDYAKKGHEIHELRPFLYRTLRHLIIDEYRKHKTTSLESMMTEEDESIEAFMPADESNTLEKAMERLDGKAAILTLEKLGDLYREVLTLRYVEGLSPKEIAMVTEESENVISVRLHRGLKKLKELLEKNNE